MAPIKQLGWRAKLPLLISSSRSSQVADGGENNK